MQENRVQKRSLATRFGGGAAFILLACGQFLQADAQILSSKRGFGDTGANFNELQAANAGWYYTWGLGLQSPGNHDALHIPQYRWWHSLSGHTDWILGRSEPTEWVFMYNEPERTDQDNLSVAQVISNWKYVQNRLDGTGIKMVTPSVSDDSGGQTWMNNFYNAVQADPNIEVDAVGFHWYGWSTPTNIAGAISNFKSRVTAYHNQWNLPVFINEFAIHDWGGGYTDEEMRAANAAFLADVVPWMESNPDVAGYAPYNWFGSSTLVEGSPLKPTNVGIEYVGAIRNGATYDASIQDLGQNVVYLANGNITKTSASGVARYINALEGTNNMTGTVNWGLNNTTDWVRVQPGAKLKKTGSNTITWRGLTATNNGTIEVSEGTLLLDDNVKVNGSGTIRVKPGATLQVDGLVSDTFGTVKSPVVLEGGTLSTTMSGGVFVTNSTTLSAAGTVSNDLIIWGGSTLQVGSAGLSSSSVKLIDDFESYDNSGGTTLGATPGNRTGDTWVGVWDGTGSAHITDDPDGDQSLAVREGSGWRGAETNLASNFATDFSLPDGQTATYFYQVMAEGTATDAMVGLSEDVSSIDENNSWQDFAVMPYVNGGNLKVYGANIGDVTVTSMTTGNWYNVWVVVDNAAKTFDMYYSTGTNDGTLFMSDIDFGRITAPVDLAAFGAMNNGVDLVHVDNLYWMSGENTANPLVGSPPLVGETFTVQGDYYMTSGTTLAIDIFDPNIHDLLDIQGELNLGLGGDLLLTLDPNAPTLQAGDTFDILDFSSSTGAFDSLTLPTLSGGLVWDTSNLYTTGALSVATAFLPGDFNMDGRVDSLDFLEWQRNPGVGNLADWEANYGLPATSSSTAVPEPTSAMLLMCMSWSLLARSRRN